MGVKTTDERSDEDTAAVAGRLREENARLVKLLQANGIEWQLHQLPEPPSIQSAKQTFEETHLTAAEKVALFRRLFRGRDDVYPVRWESKTEKSGYSPACANEWRAGVCEKPRVKCSDCSHRQLIPLADQVIYDHLAGRHTVGVYPLLLDDTCHFLAVDFDEADWQEDAQAFIESCREFDVPVALEISRSGKGAHLWIFFSSAVPACDARRLGTAIISHTCARTRQLNLSSYDRLFSNQDSLPKGGYGNLIALPLQKKSRDRGCSVFVDDQFQPYGDQWKFLASVRSMTPELVDPTITRITGGTHPLDVTFVSEEDAEKPWKRSAASSEKLAGPMPQSLTMTLAGQLYFEKSHLPQSLTNRLIRLAAFQNPEFYRAQAMRFPVWDKPRVIGCAENHPKHISLPRGCLDAVMELLRDNRIECRLQDERFPGNPLNVVFTGRLHPEQEKAVDKMLRFDIGVLCAPTAFGKTVAAIAMIARRGINTLILVHRTELMKQWQERLQTFLALTKGMIGNIGGGKNKPTGQIDIAVIQSLSRLGKVSEIIENYGHIIIDECHHLSAVSFESALKHAKAQYVLGLTATPVRRDGQQPIIFMQCGPIRHTVRLSKDSPHKLDVCARFLPQGLLLLAGAAIQDVFRELCTNEQRTAEIISDIIAAYQEGRKVLVLTERTEHLQAINTRLESSIESLFVLHGRMSGKQRRELIKTLTELPETAPRVLLATGRLIGEGFDHPPLDTLILAMPISWKGTLQQYAGRLHRELADKKEVRIYDYVDEGHPALIRMWKKRQLGYRAMGYEINGIPTDSIIIP
jgi:superfamily II DNA or RNA helicase